MKEIIEKLNELEALVKANKNIISIYINFKDEKSVLINKFSEIPDIPAPVKIREQFMSSDCWEELSTTVDGVIIHTWNKIEKEAAANA